MGNSSFELIVRGVIRERNQILVCKRKDRDYYFLPGGHIEFGEKSEDALIRELNEELNISIKHFSFIGVVENVFKEDDEIHHEVNLVFEVLTNKAEDKSREDHIDFFFFDKKRFLKEKVLPPALKEAVIQWQKDKKIFWKSNSEI